MHLKKVISLLLVLCMVFALGGCGSKTPTVDELNNISDPSSNTSSEEKVILNPLTGESGYSAARVNKRPVAVMINNISIAQKVQTGVGKADIVFETEVEGGITRLMAVFSDPSKVSGAIGTIRSARLAYVDIAKGLNAVYIHHGSDEKYCSPHIKEIGLDHVNIGSPYAYRQSNGLSTEHTLYTTGTNLDALLKEKGYNNDSTVKPFATFTNEDSFITPAEGTCTYASVPFSTSYVTDFVYNEETGKYARAKNKVAFTDYSTGEKEEFKNVFVLKTEMSLYSDGYHRDIDLTSGTGFYISNGGYEAINWEKGAAANNFKFTKTDGSELTVNAGNSYVCIIRSSGKVSVQ